MSAMILKGAYVMSPEGLKKDYGIRIEDNKIDQVEPNDFLIVKAGDEVLEIKDQIILPGFVNGHNHMYGFLSHGITAEAMVTEFSSFLDDFWWPYVEDRLNHVLIWATTRWACVEMIESGVTSFVDILEGPNAIPGALMIEKKIVAEAGLRGRLSFEACERVSKDNARSGLKENLDFIDQCAQEGNLIQGINSIHTLFTCSKDFVRLAKQEGNARNVLTHMHLSESEFEAKWCRKNYGKTPVEVYEELGFLDQHVLASQVVNVQDFEMDILARNNVKAVSMPLSNCEVGGGFAPLEKMLNRGMTVGLGTDGYINNFFEVMRGAFLVHKANQKDPQAMPAKLVYQMATSMGADAIGIPQTGRLEPGKLADIITVNMNLPTPINEKNIYDQLVLFANPDKVINVICNGKYLKRDGKLITIDKEQARRELNSITEEFWKVNK